MLRVVLQGTLGQFMRAARATRQARAPRAARRLAWRRLNARLGHYCENAVTTFQYRQETWTDMPAARRFRPGDCGTGSKRLASCSSNSPRRGQGAGTVHVEGRYRARRGVAGPVRVRAARRCGPGAYGGRRWRAGVPDRRPPRRRACGADKRPCGWCGSPTTLTGGARCGRTASPAAWPGNRLAYCALCAIVCGVCLARDKIAILGVLREAGDVTSSDI
jgi:hypothetical protein